MELFTFPAMTSCDIRNIPTTNVGGPFSARAAMYGVNYPRLRSIKVKYDAQHICYAITAVRGDEYEVDSRGVMCKVLG